MNRIEHALKHNKCLQSIYVFIFSGLFKFLGLFIRSKKNLILFQSLIGKNFGESPKILYDCIINDPYFKDYQTVWAFDDPKKYEQCKCKKVKLNSFKYFYYALRSSIWISNAGIERGLRFKHKKTIHINTDHGFAFKKIGNHQPNRKDYNFKTVDLFCCCSEFDRKNKISGYRIKPENAKVIGYPINDALFNVSENEVNVLRKRLNIPGNKKIILYAPTWRDNEEIRFLNIDKWKNVLGNDYVLFVRGHHLTSSKSIGESVFVRDGNSNISVEDICKVTDILVTDYSAILFNYSILHRPIIGYTYDFDVYSKTRGTYLSLEDVYGEAHFDNEDELINFIKNINYQKQCEKTKNLQQKFMFCDGHATQKCIEFLKEEIHKRKLAIKHHV